MNNPILYQGVGGLMIVFFLVLIYFFTKTWRWFHIVCVVFVFFATIFLVIYAAGVYRTWNEWRRLVSKTTKMSEELEEQHDKLRYGKYDDTEQKEESSRLLRAKIGRVILDRGRVWRNCTPGAPANDATVTVNTIPPGALAAPAATPVVPVAPATPPGGAVPAAGGAAAPAAPAAPAGPPPNRIQEQTVLYVFREAIPPPETGAPPGIPLPQYYIGDFVAVAVTDTSVTLKPLTPLSQGDAIVLNMPQSTWTLFETLPVDGHEWFSTDPDQKPDWNKPADEEPVFGKNNESAIKALFAWPRFDVRMFPSGDEEFQQAAARLNAVTQTYLRDGKRAADDDPPMTRWMKVRFLKPHKETVDSGAKVSPFAPGVTDDFFDRGLAEVAPLQIGKEAEFKQGDVAIFPEEDANKLIASGLCQLVEPIFARRLNDYLFLFANFNTRQDKITNDTAQIVRDIQDLQQSQTSVNRQLALANEDKTKLDADLVKTNADEKKIADYLALLEKKWNDTRAALSLLYRTNLQLEEEFERLNKALEDEINRRTLQAVAEK